MIELLFGKALLIGFSIAAPPGPVGVLCMQRTLRHGARTGFASGMGAACADACYGALGALGTGALIRLFTTQAPLIGWVGALGLGLLGLGMLRGGGRGSGGADTATLTLAGAWLSVFALTLTNPMTILSFAAVFAALGGGAVLAGPEIAVMVSGVFCGSALWWGLLAWGVGRARHRIGDRARRRIGQCSGMALIGFSGWQLALHWPF
jgi:threonine/homoserine/homoserine lactone efflux protein